MKPGARHGRISASHVPDVLAEGLAVVFCGTALGRVSAEKRAYYANPGNFFWRTLHHTGMTPRLLAPTEYAQALRYGIGLTDLCKTAFGQDAELPADAFDVAGLRQKILHYRPAFLAFTSKAGATEVLGAAHTGAVAYGEQAERIGNTRIFVLPSPSGQARKYWQTGPWQALADSVAQLKVFGDAGEAAERI
ncbi:MAG: mismatch-specific DNA-glycosylase [Proteobacteria bacterium]|nr:mismatch-specific DNA-glycosylase [Pseudomonadota bacterium]